MTKHIHMNVTDCYGHPGRITMFQLAGGLFRLQVYDNDSAGDDGELGSVNGGFGAVNLTKDEVKQLVMHLLALTRGDANG